MTLLPTDIKLCSKKIQARANLSASGLMVQETNDRNKQNCPGEHRIGSLSMTRDCAFCPAILTSVAKQRSGR
jgi:hypothetical protein